MLIKDDLNPESTIKYYAIYKDEINELIGMVDENCNPITLSSCSMVDGNPPLPPCAQQQP
jgi:hypothetical protein